MNPYFLKQKIQRLFYKFIRSNPGKMSMVEYWKTKDAVQAKVMRTKEGHLVMQMEGEKELFPGFPRGHLLFGTLSKLKHEIKIQLFNDSYWKLLAGAPRESVIKDIKELVLELEPVIDAARYDMVPYDKLNPPARELWRALSRIEGNSRRVKILKRMLTYILQEDDAYRFRFQWMTKIFNPDSVFCRDPIKEFNRGLDEMVRAEVIIDMKIRVVLFKTIFNLMMQDKVIKEWFIKLCREINWKKMALTPGDIYHFRGKWFRVDFDKFEY